MILTCSPTISLPRIVVAPCSAPSSSMHEAHDRRQSRATRLHGARIATIGDDPFSRYELAEIAERCDGTHRPARRQPDAGDPPRAVPGGRDAGAASAGDRRHRRVGARRDAGVARRRLPPRVAPQGVPPGGRGVERPPARAAAARSRPSAWGRRPARAASRRAAAAASPDATSYAALTLFFGALTTLRRALVTGREPTEGAQHAATNPRPHVDHHGGRRARRLGGRRRARRRRDQRVSSTATPAAAAATTTPGTTTPGTTAPDPSTMKQGPGETLLTGDTAAKVDGGRQGRAARRDDHPGRDRLGRRRVRGPHAEGRRHAGNP